MHAIVLVLYSLLICFSFTGGDEEYSNQPCHKMLNMRQIIYCSGIFFSLYVISLIPGLAALEKGSIYARDYYGDTFSVQTSGNCSKETCNGNGRRQANVLPGTRIQGVCVCQCSPMFKTFRDDTFECVNDMKGQLTIPHTESFDWFGYNNQLVT